jgi:DNA-directed RNA polymerase specialized sigma24 family protein
VAEDLVFPWDTLLELQQLTDEPTISARSHAADEAFAALLDEVATVRAPTTAEGLNQRFWTLAGNRARKYRFRSAAEAQVLQHELKQRWTADAQEVAAYRELLVLAFGQINVADAEILTKVFGEGLQYREAAATLGKRVGTVKARTSRARTRMYKSPAAAVILNTLRAA